MIFGVSVFTIANLSLLFVFVWISRPIFFALLHYNFQTRSYQTSQFFDFLIFEDSYRKIIYRICNLNKMLFALVKTKQFTSILGLSLFYTLSFIFLALAFGWAGNLTVLEINNAQNGLLSRQIISILNKFSLEKGVNAEEFWQAFSAIKPFLIAGLFWGTYRVVYCYDWLAWPRIFSWKHVWRGGWWLVLPTIAFFPRLTDFFWGQKIGDLTFTQGLRGSEVAAIGLTILLFALHLWTLKSKLTDNNKINLDELQTTPYIQMAIIGSVALIFAHLGEIVAGIAVVSASAYLGLHWKAGGLTVIIAFMTLLPMLWVIDFLTFFVLFIFVCFVWFGSTTLQFSSKKRLLLQSSLPYNASIYENNASNILEYSLSELRKMALMVAAGASAFLLLGDYLFQSKEIPILAFVIALVWIILPLLNAVIDFISWKITGSILLRIQRSDRIGLLDALGYLFLDLSKGFFIVFLAIEIYVFATSGFLATFGFAIVDNGGWLENGPVKPHSQHAIWFVILSLTALFPTLLHAIALPESLSMLNRGKIFTEAPIGIPSLLSAPAVVLFIIAATFTMLENIKVGWLTYLFLPQILGVG